MAEALILAGALYTPEAYAIWADVIEAAPEKMFPRILDRFRSGAQTPAAACIAARRRLTRSRAVQRHDAAFGQRHPVAPRDPTCDGRQKLWRAVVGGIDTEACDIGGHDRGDEIRHRVARLADGHGDGVCPRRMTVQQPPQTRKRILRQV